MHVTAVNECTRFGLTAYYRDVTESAAPAYATEAAKDEAQPKKKLLLAKFGGKYTSSAGTLSLLVCVPSRVERLGPSARPFTIHSSSP
jgi:hypothetical protein